MAGGMKSLAKDTAIYGLSSIVGRFINWMLVPVYTNILTRGEYGIVTNVYGYVALILVILTYGMETGFFRFMNKKDANPTETYSTILTSLFTTSVLFAVLCFVFIEPIGHFTGYENYHNYLLIMAVTVAIDAFTTIPFAYLRYKQRPIKFASVQLGSIAISIFFNLFFLLACPWLHDNAPSTISWFYDPEYREGYVFVANLISSLAVLIALIPEFTGFKYQFNPQLLKQILKYSFPLLILGIAGILNQTIDKILYPFLFDDKAEAFEQLGIYGACFRIAVVMMMFTQAFRFAYEPFIFAQNRGSETKPYTEAMKYFIIFSLIIFLGVMFYIDIIKYFVGKDFFAGLDVVPIVMLGYIFFGIYFNLSFWYKMLDKTYFGAIFSIVGCVITIAINIIFVPKYGYIASAWASLVCNFVMMMISYLFEQKYRPLKYDYKTIGLYFSLATVLYAASYFVSIDNLALRLLFRTALFGIFMGVVFTRDLPLSQFKSVGSFLRKK